jgi:hypothetical protein
LISVVHWNAALTAAAIALVLVGSGGCGNDDRAQRELAEARAQIKRERDQIGAERDRLAADRAAAEQNVADLRDEYGDETEKIVEARRKLRRLQKQIKGARATVAKNTIPGDGTFVVGEDINPGVYRAEASPGCYWERLSSLSGSGISNIIENENADGPVVVQVLPSDRAISTARCADFHKAG